MKRVCISTFCVWNSYGSMLQAYGLQHALKQIDCQGVIASAKPAPEERWTFPGFRAGGMKGMIVDAHRLLIRTRLKRKYAAANRFISENIHIAYYGSYEALSQDPPQADVYLAGSDQVWNPRKMDPAFFLTFIPAGCSRISYAASMGITNVPEENREKFAQLVDSFEQISLREQDNLPVIREFTERPLDVHVDPVFLVPPEHWREMEKPYPIEGPYILVYPIYWNKALNQDLKRLHEQTGKPIVAVLGQAQQVYANKRIYDASPEQFLWLIDHADGVVSSSFHGIAMSLVFEKAFAAVIDPNSASRLNCLLDTLGAENRAIRQLAEDDSRDHGAIRKRIRNERDRSMTYLRKVLYSK